MHGNQVRLDGRRIGWITRTMDEKRVFISPRNRPEHFFRIFKGWALSRDVLNFLEQNNFDEVHLRIGKRETLISSLSIWREHGIPYQKLPFEPQIVLPETFMTKKMLSLSEVME